MPSSKSSAHHYSDLSPNASVWPVVAATGLLGFAMGVANATWQANAETAQVLAGLVKYPADNSYYIYHVKLWSLLNQIPALLLHLGMSERFFSILMSGILGLCAYVAFGLWTLALSKHRLLAIIAPAVIHAAVFADGLHNFGVIYPIFILGTLHTYGMFGATYALIILGLLGLGCRRSGFLLLGLAPAIHPSLGLWCIGITALAIAWDHHQWRQQWRPVAAYFLAGVMLSVLSLAYQVAVARGLPDITPQLKAQYLDAFVSHWDGHRRPVTLTQYRGLTIALVALLTSALWLWRLPRDVPQHAKFLLRITVISSGLGLFFCALTHWHHAMPTAVVMAMPGRFVNLTILAYPALLIGLLGAYHRKLLLSVLLACVMLGLAVSQVRPWVPWIPGWHTLWTVLCFTPAAMLALHALSSRWQTLNRPGLVNAVGVLTLILAFVIFAKVADRTLLVAILALVIAARLAWSSARKAAVSLIASAAAVAVLGVAVHSHWADAADELRDWSNDPLYAQVHAGEGMLLTCSNQFFVQLKSRRPVLLCGGALDTLAYMPESGPRMQQVLRQVYGIDLLDPPAEIRQARPGALLPDTGKALWEARSMAQWRSVVEPFGVTQVLAYADWKIDLPEVARNSKSALYRIPTSSGLAGMIDE